MRFKSKMIAQTVAGSCRIDMRFMIRNNFIIRESDTSGALEWTGGESIHFKCQMSQNEKYLQLMYSVEDVNGSSTDYNYKIEIVEVPSNLGKGSLLYFKCPESEKRSRILISAYGDHRFLNRQYYETKYGKRLYYGCQKTSKSDYHNTRYFDLKRKVDNLEEELNKKHRKRTYDGEPTKSHKYLAELKLNMQHHNQKRIQILEQFLKR